jgi:hypothetical protein
MLDSRNPILPIRRIKMEGLWHTHFKSGTAQGDGLVVLRDGEILGGDPAHTYFGTYQFDGPRLYARVNVHPYGTGTVPEHQDRPFTLGLAGTFAGNTAAVSGHPDERKDVSIEIELHKAI